MDEECLCICCNLDGFEGCPKSDAQENEMALKKENKKLKEQQLKLDCENNLTEDEIVEVMTKEYSRDKHFINNKNYSNATLNVIFSEKKLIAKAIIKAREEKQTRTCDPECPFYKTEEASK